MAGGVLDNDWQQAPIITVPDDVPPMDPVVAPTRARPNQGGRPPGEKTDPRKLAAARAAAKPRAAQAVDEAMGKIIDPRAGAGPGRPTKTASESAQLATRLQAMYELCGTLLQSVAMLPHCGRAGIVGAAMQTNAEACAKSVVSYSETNEAVRRMLQNAGAGAGVLAVVIAHAPIAMAAFARQAGPGEAPSMGQMMADAMAVVNAPGFDPSAFMSGLFAPAEATGPDADAPTA